MAEKTGANSSKKMTVKVWKPILEKLDAKLDSACLRRDAYLAEVLSNEIERLDEEVAIPNSPGGYEYVAANLDLLDRKLVSLAFPVDVINRINEVCERKQIVRDAWFNRVLLLLVAGPKTVDQLLFWSYEGDWRKDAWARFGSDETTFREAFEPMEAHMRPFAWFREGLWVSNEGEKLDDYFEPSTGNPVKVTYTLTGQPELPDGLYTTRFSKPKGEGVNLVGLNTYMPDWEIPGHSLAIAEGLMLDKLFGEI